MFNSLDQKDDFEMPRRRNNPPSRTFNDSTNVDLFEIVEDGKWDLDKYTLIHKAAFGGHLQILQYLQKLGGSLTSKNKFGITPLHYACSKDHTNVVKYLVDKKIDINLKNSKGNTALLNSVYKGDIVTVKYLLKHGAMKVINTPNNNGETPIYAAGCKGHTKLFYFLLKEGADLSIKTKDGKSTKDIAFERKNFEIMDHWQKGKKLIVENIDDVEFDEPIINVKTPISIIAKNEIQLNLKYAKINQQKQQPSMNPELKYKHGGNDVPEFDLDWENEANVPDFNIEIPKMVELDLESEEIEYSEIKKYILIGEGSYGKVYRGSYKHLIVAIKEIEMSFSPEIIKEEVNLINSINSPYVIKVFGYSIDKSKGTFNIIMEYLNGGTLTELIKNKKVTLSIAEKIGIAKMMTKSILALHHKNIVHRDIKGLNFLLSKDRKMIKITDFGLAKIKISSKSIVETKSKNIGTVRWTAPELIGFRPKYSFYSDVYSLGLTFYELFSGTIPFEEQPSDTVILNLIKNDSDNSMKFELIDELKCSNDIKAVIKMCVTHDYKQRPSTSLLLALIEKMEGNHIKKKVKEKKEFLCPLTLKILDEPVILEDSGNVYELNSIVEYLKYHDVEPVTGKKLKSKKIKLDKKMKREIMEWKKTIFK